MSSKRQSTATPAAGKARRPARIGSPLTLRLRQLGCVYCAECRCFMAPEHGPRDRHIDLALDLQASRYRVVGSFGKVGLELADTVEAPAIEAAMAVVA